MIKTFKPIAVLFFLVAGIFQVKAQDTNENYNDNKSSHGENIIIHKKGAVKEKLTVVIDSNNITINGKPVDDFKSDDIDIEREDNDMSFNLSGDGDISVMPRIAPRIRTFNNDMMRKIKTNSAFLGVMSDKTEEGAKITEVTKESAAEKAGLKEGDIITKINTTAIAGPDDLYKAVGQCKPDEKITITYLRNGKQQTAQAVLGKSNQVRVYSWNSPDGQFDMKGFDPQNFSFAWNGDKLRLGIEAQDTEDGNGVKVTDVDDDADVPAAKAGLKKDDIITQVNGKAISSVDDLKESIKDVKKGDTVKITYKRNNQTQTAEVKFPKELKTIDL
jgi:serine protease Do